MQYKRMGMTIRGIIFKIKKKHFILYYQIGNRYGYLAFNEYTYHTALSVQGRTVYSYCLVIKLISKNIKKK